MYSHDFAWVENILMILLITELSATVTQGPSNTVAKIGEQSKLSCSATAQVAYWFISKTGNNTEEVAIAGLGCSVNLEFADHYAVESLNGGKTCNLIILNITMEQAGVYRCSDATNQLWSLFTVTGYSPVIAVNDTGKNVVENESVIIECALNYKGSMLPAPTLRPYFYWTDSNGQNISSFYDSTIENWAASRLLVTAGRHDIMPYTCHVYLRLTPPTIPNYTNNTPTVNSSASSSTIGVIYPVENITTHSTVPTDDKCVSKTETLTCTADANPPAQYFWLDLNNNINTTGAIKSISSGGEYQCIASNIIRNQAYTETKNEIVASCYSPYNLTIIGTNCANNFCTCQGNDSYSEQISITCMANGIPIPSVKWRSDNQFDGLDETIGVILNGDYSCIASNTYGGNPYSAELTVVISGCRTTTVCSSSTNNCDAAVDAAIAMGVLFGISLVANVILLVILIRRQDSSKRKENIPEPQLPYHSDSFPPAAYEELRPNDELNLQPTAYEQLTHRPPLYANQVS